MPDQRLRFLAATPEYEGVAALEPQDPFARPRQLDELQGNVALLWARLAAAFSRKDPRTTVVVIDEVKLDNWGIAGLPVREFRLNQLEEAAAS